MKTLAALAITALSLTLPAHALAATPLSKIVDGNVYIWPTIGTIAYSQSCSITWAAEDGSAEAYCTEDGGRFYFDPDGDVTTGKQAGWYVVK